jgi:hypothetical protein
MLSNKVGWARPCRIALVRNLSARRRLHSSASNAVGVQRSHVGAQGRVLASIQQSSNPMAL